MPVGVRDIWEHLAIEPEEAIVLSAIYETVDDVPKLMAASLLAGPSEIAASGWPGWRLAEGFKPQPEGDILSIPAEFVVELEGAIAGRAILNPADAYRWLRAALEQGAAPSVGSLPEADAALGPSSGTNSCWNTFTNRSRKARDMAGSTDHGFSLPTDD